MRLFHPTEVYFENNAVKKYGNKIDGQNVLILTGRNSSKANHSLDDVITSIGPKTTVYVCNEVTADPTVSMVKDIAEKYRTSKIDVCIGVGGGSAIDAAKAISVLLANESNSNIEELFFKNRKATHLPIVAVPTTCGTGSEVTPFSVLTDAERRTKRTVFSQLYPRLALVDCKYLETISYRDCVSTCVDALSHLIEAYLSSRASDYNRFYSLTGLKLFSEFKSILLSPEKFETINDSIREKMMACAMFGGYAIALNGSGIPHGLANSFPHELNISHGRSVILFIPGFLRNFQGQDEVAHIMMILGFRDVDDFEEYLYSILGSISVPKKLWVNETEKMLSNTHKLSSYPYEMTRNILDSYPGKLFQVTDGRVEYNK